MRLIIKILFRIWDSPTFTTWGSFFIKSISMTLILSIVLIRFSSSDVALWFLFSTLFSIQSIIDFGFNPTFSRSISYARGGASINEIADFRENKIRRIDNDINIVTLSRIIPTMNKIYKLTSLFSLVVMGTIGTLMLFEPIRQTDNVNNSWIAWGIVLVASVMNLRGNKYLAYLIGMNYIALVRRWEILFSLGRLITQLVVLLFFPSILGLVIVTHIWTLLNVLRNRYLSTKIKNGIYKKFENYPFNKVVFKSLWTSAWKSGLGMGLGYGLIQISGLIYAQFESSKNVASFLLSLRLMDAVVQFSQAPFYSKLPLLATLRSKGDLEKQIAVAYRGMKISYISFVAGCLLVGIFSDIFLTILKSDTEFVPLQFWCLLSIANLIHRYGAMHIQLYSTTNYIIWHIADSVSGVIYIIISLLLFEALGIYSFVIGMLCGYIGFYSWYAARHSYKAFQLKFWRFDKNAIFSLIILIIFTFITMGL